MEKNTFRVDTSGNAELKDYFARKKPGHSCTLSVTFVLTETTPDGVTGKIKEIELPGDEDYEEETVTPTGETPVSMMAEGKMPMMNKAYATTPEMPD